MPKSLTSANQLSPVGQRFSQMFRLSILGKRSHEEPAEAIHPSSDPDYEVSNDRLPAMIIPRDVRPDRTPSACAHPPTSLSACSTHTKALRVALQHEDEDTIVITALDSLPFCCHDDLLSMSRENLVKTATSLNAKLPGALYIDTRSPRSEKYILESIEVLVGIRRPRQGQKYPPDAPKPTRSVRLDMSEDFVLRSPPTSPLAKRRRPSDMYSPLAASPRLERLLEESEDEETSPLEKPVAKKRKLVASSDSSTPRPRNPVGRQARIDDSFPAIDSVLATPTSTYRPRPHLTQAGVGNGSHLMRAHSKGLSPRPDMDQPPCPRRSLSDKAERLPLQDRHVTINRPRYNLKQGVRSVGEEEGSSDNEQDRDGDVKMT